MNLNKSSLFTGIVQSLEAIHYGHYSSPPSRRGHRRTYEAKTSIWANVLMDNGHTIRVWVQSFPGTSSMRVKQQESQAESKCQHLVGKKVQFKITRNSGCFYEGLV